MRESEFNAMFYEYHLDSQYRDFIEENSDMKYSNDEMIDLMDAEYMLTEFKKFMLKDKK